MTNYRIHPLVVGKIGAVKGVATNMVDMMTPVVCPVLSIAGSRKHIIPGHDPSIVGKILPEK